ncbi:MAG: hypothetical protein JWO57_4053 [Pseudonocardiales bacterium]|nr:hypothetical protein [Pseudonocardiales bacterium]
MAAVGYDAVSATLRVRFRNGRLYDYLGVPTHVHDDLLTNAHPWTTWGMHIKRTYRFERLE